MAKILCFIYDNMADFELTLATHLMSAIGKEVVTIAYTKQQVTSRPGVQYLPHVTVSEALALEDVEGLIIPGGWNDEQRPELTELIVRLYNSNKLLAAICAGPQYLARAGVLDGAKYTTTLSVEEMAKRGVADPFPRESFVKNNVVRDKNIVTATGNAFVDFAVELVDYFGPCTAEQKTTYSRMFKGE